MENADEIVRALRSYAKNAQENFDAAADTIERLNDFEHSQCTKLLARIAELEAQLTAERAKYAELQRYNVDCTKQCDALIVEKIDLKAQFAESQRQLRAAVKKRHGRWINYYHTGPSSFSGTCSVCRATNDIPQIISAHYCPNCGCPMDGPQETGKGEAE